MHISSSLLSQTEALSSSEGLYFSIVPGNIFSILFSVQQIRIRFGILQPLILGRHFGLSWLCTYGNTRQRHAAWHILLSDVKWVTSSFFSFVFFKPNHHHNDWRVSDDPWNWSRFFYPILIVLKDVKFTCSIQNAHSQHSIYFFVRNWCRSSGLSWTFEMEWNGIEILLMLQFEILGDKSRLKSQQLPHTAVESAFFCVSRRLEFIWKTKTKIKTKILGFFLLKWSFHCSSNKIQKPFCKWSEYRQGGIFALAIRRWAV